MTNTARTYFWATQFYQDLVTNTVTRECVDEWRKTLLSSTEIFLFSWVVFSVSVVAYRTRTLPTRTRRRTIIWCLLVREVAICFNSCNMSIRWTNLYLWFLVCQVFLCLAQDWDLDSLFLTSRNKCHFLSSKCRVMKNIQLGYTINYPINSFLRNWEAEKLKNRIKLKQQINPSLYIR